MRRFIRLIILLGQYNKCKLIAFKIEKSGKPSINISSMRMFQIFVQSCKLYHTDNHIMIAL
jgi:hypothetical protein